MATNHTQHYALSQWEPQDAFVRTEFNEDHQKIDAALAGLERDKAPRTDVTALSSSKADQTEVSRLQTQVSALSTQVDLRCHAKAGVYTGDGSSSQFIDVGFPVIAVLLENAMGSRNSSSNSGTSGGLAVRGGSIYHGVTLASVSGTGFYVYNGGEYQGGFNRQGGAYHFIAWG